MASTIVEKILSSHCKKKVKAGDFAICDVDFCFGQDGTSNIIIDRIKELGLNKLKNSSKFAMVIDHSAPSPNMEVSAVHKRMRGFAKKFNSKFFDISAGVCHQVIPESGYCLPGNLVLGADSHTCTYGALGVFSSGVGSTDLAITLATGKNWFKVPETIKITLMGKLKKGVFAKDVILFLITKLGINAATYKAIEFYGSIINNLDMAGRFTISNMAVEMGAKAGIIPVDRITLAWMKKHFNKKIKPVYADKGADYEKEYRFNLSSLNPIVAKPHSPGNGVCVTKLKNIKIDQGFIGTCTNGRLEDLAIAARILKGKKVTPGIKLIIAAASRRIYLEALKKGYIEIFIKSGASVINPGCGPCVGTHAGIPADKEIVISTANRNFKGRMGNPKANIYLASPATVAVSCLKGKITDPRNYL
ncbi:MAG: 3-isopropylmalate dehydratase large subunit [Candidatus Gygaella obscura]|nr:3-isopropylmalate dehydratase large subunit [Candidatus Gygaella obscura]